MPMRRAHTGDIHLDEGRYFADTAQCLEWFVADAIWASFNLFVINGDLTTYKATINRLASAGTRGRCAGYRSVVRPAAARSFEYQVRRRSNRLP
jgi:hypothetical protein